MAKKFKFRAETVLKLRTQREQIARRRLAESQSKVNRIQQRIQQLRAELARQDELVRDGVLTGAVDVHYMSLYRRHVMALHRSLIEQVRLLQSAAGELQGLRTDLIEAVKQRKVMSKLKDNLKRKHMEQLARDEAIELDEMSSMRFGYGRTFGEG